MAITKKITKKKTKKTKPVDITNQVDTTNMDLENFDYMSNLVEIPKPTPKRVVSKKNPKKKPPAPVTDDNSDENETHIPEEIGILALRNVVVFPGTVTPLAIGRPRSQQLISDLTESRSSGTTIVNTQDSEKIIGVLTQKLPEEDDPGFDGLYAIGTIVNVLKKLKLPDGHNSLVVHGVIRFRVVQWLGDEPYLRARVEVLEPSCQSTRNLKALVNNVRNMAHKMVDLSPNIPDEVQVIVHNIEEPGALADFLAANINITVAEKQQLLETLDVNRRLEKLSVALASQLELLELSVELQNKVNKSIDKSQREYYLQEQLKAIQKELGHSDQRTAEIDELKERIEKAKMPEKVNAEALRELNRLEKIPTMSPEYSVSRNYLEWLCELPWDISTQDKLNLNAAKRILNQDHYDLVKIKKRILEFLAVRKLNPTGRSPILCFSGPPGVGKTSLGKSIARSMGRKFIRISLGGIRDEADIRGHRRTYIGALPGRVIQELRKCGSNNPVFMLDELDKIGQDFRGDPASALLEVLDPEQNNTFTDHFLDLPFDLSKVMFIGTANYMGNVPPALRDRLEVLTLPGYTSAEKLLIAKKYQVPRQVAENGLTESKIKFSDSVLTKMIESYTAEAGVRELERKIAAVCRSVAAQVAVGKKQSPAISLTHLEEILGPIQYESELALRTSIPGVATGLAYTTVGGEILFIETTLTPGKGQLILTGQLGDVMKESAQTALSVLKSSTVTWQKKTHGSYGNIQKRLAQILTEEKLLDKHDIHVHVPAGAVPKDGPSAGLAMYTAMASLITQIPVRADIAMTGEITLRGLALPIGGIKEKILAAKQAGIKTVILPDRNKKDLADLTRDVTRGLKFQFVKNVDNVLKIALKNA